MTPAKKGPEPVYLSISNLGWLCASFLGAMTVHAAIVIPVLARRTETILAQALESSIQNQNRILGKLEERFDRIEALMKESR